MTERKEAVRAWVPVRGAGIYRNDETRLEREFRYPPTRGKWTLIRERRIPLLVIGDIIYWRRACNG